MRALLSLLILIGFGCGLSRAEDIPLPRPRPAMVTPPSWVATSWSEPRSFREAAGPDFKSDEVTSEPSACRQRLEKFASIEAMPRLIGPGACGGSDIVRLDSVRLADGKTVEIKPAPYLQCPMAEQLALWTRDDAAPKVKIAGEVLTRVDTYDDFSCRGRNRKLTGKISEHGKANAVDIRGFTFAAGPLAKLTDIKLDKPLRESLRQSACARFTTVLGPGSDGYHEEHIHLDFVQRHNGYRICQWDVREPPPPPNPPEKPPEISQDKQPEKTPDNPIAKVASAPSAPSSPSAAVSPTPPTPTGAAAASSAIAAAAANQTATKADVAVVYAEVPLPTPRPAKAAKTRRGKRKTSGPFHFPFTLWR